MPSQNNNSVETQKALKQLKCEMCGSTDLVQQDDGIYVCQYCKARYTVIQVQDKPTEGDKGIPILKKIDEKEKLENLYALANQALEQQKYEEALSYYRMILEEQKDHWQPVFYTNYLNFLCTGITFDNMASELDALGNGFIDAVKLFVGTEDFRKQPNIIQDFIDKLYKICKEHENNNSAWMKNHYKEYNALEYLNRNKNSISVLYALFGNYSDQYLNNKKNALFYWKKACELTQDKKLKKSIIEKIHKYEPKYRPPSIVLIGLSKGCLLFVGIFVSIILGLLLSYKLFGDNGVVYGMIGLFIFFLYYVNT